MPSSLTGQRKPSFRYTEVTPTGARVRVLRDVFAADGRLELSQQAEIRTSGDLVRAVAAGAMPNRIKIEYVLDEGEATEQAWPLGVMHSSSPTSRHGDGVATSTVEVYDGTLLLVEDKIDRPLFVPAGTEAVTEAIAQLRAAGIPSDLISITDSPKVLRTGMAWPVGTKRLRIVNDLLDAADYFTIWCDSNGVFRGERYRRPKERGVSWRFTPGEDSIFIYPFDVDEDVYSVPNKVIATSQVSGDKKILWAVASIEDTSSPFHVDNLGRWRVEVLENVSLAIAAPSGNPDMTEAERAAEEALREGEALQLLQEMANRKLEEVSVVARTIRLQHAWVPIEINDVVEFSCDGVEGRFVLINQSIPLDPTQLVTSTLKEVSTLDDGS